jgi:transcriptional regulator with XRE-family HTH domain
MNNQVSQLNRTFTDSLRNWRKHRKMSQLDLALAADVSQRHVSWLETGRSQPSREMVVKLSDAMEVPLRDRNLILNSAGFAKLYADRDLSEPSMEPVTEILTDMLAHHNPYPAFVLDRMWNIKMKNEAAGVLFDILGKPEEVWRDVGDTGEFNIALLTVHPKGLRQYISNWDEVAPPFMRRLKKEAMDSGDAGLISRYEQLYEYVGDIVDNPDLGDLLPILPLEIDLGGPVLKLCSVISSFGTAQDITSNELRIETFYPADETTRRFFKD